MYAVTYCKWILASCFTWSCRRRDDTSAVSIYLLQGDWHLREGKHLVLATRLTSVDVNFWRPWIDGWLDGWTGTEDLGCACAVHVRPLFVDVFVCACVALVVVVFVVRLFFWTVDFHCFVGSFSLLCNNGDLVSTYKIVRRFASIAFVKVCEMFTVIFLCASCSGNGCHRHIVSLSHQFELLLFLFLLLLLLLLLLWSWFCKIDWRVAFARLWIAREGTPQAESVAMEAGCVEFLDHHLISELVYIHCRPRPPQRKVFAWMSTSSKPGTSYILSNSSRGQQFNIIWLLFCPMAFCWGGHDKCSILVDEFPWWGEHGGFTATSPWHFASSCRWNRGHGRASQPRRH